nr:mediator of RNA polymerase II transcription subunit 25-like [Anas platyrhynchos]|eukprot:XP_027303113.1 mediator of RNA polymerase II transcription subunit 25-like isoform X1 [Anas platyrhynchos]
MATTSPRPHGGPGGAAAAGHPGALGAGGGGADPRDPPRDPQRLRDPAVGPGLRLLLLHHPAHHCGMAVTTVGLGDAAGAPEGQPPRHLYRVALAAYLLLGVTAALLLLAAFQQLLELHGVSAALRPPPDPPEEDGGLLDEGGQ